MCMYTDQTLLWMYKLRTKLPASTHMSQIGCCIYTCTYSKHLHNRVAGRVASYVHNSINKLKTTHSFKFLLSFHSFETNNGEHKL